MLLPVRTSGIHGSALASLLCLLFQLTFAAWGHAQQAPKLLPIDLSAPMAEEFSLERAIDYADASANAWRASKDCVTCHTNGLHLISRAWAGAPSPELIASQDFARQYLSRYVIEKKPRAGQAGAVEGLVATTAMLAISELQAGGELSDITAASFEHVLGMQSEQGHWPTWLKCMWPPYEVDDHFGVSLSLVALGMAPDEFREREGIRSGLKRLTDYVRKNPPQNPHQMGMLLWVGRHLPGVVTRSKRRRWTRELKALQAEDGGWALDHLGGEQWTRPDGSPLDQTSDAYATAFSVFALTQAAPESEQMTIQRGLGWLRENQRASGLWAARSPTKGSKHYISHAATHFAIMAFTELGEVD